MGLQERMRQRYAQKPKSPSRFQPWESWHKNDADRIERSMQAEGHRSWGFVIYRTTYESQYDWEECLRRIEYEIADDLIALHASEMMESHVLTIFDDEKTFDNLDAAGVRQHFKRWAAEALPSEQPDAITTRPIDLYTIAPRYYYAIQIDAAALASVVSAPLKDFGYSDVMKQPGWVKLIDKEWLPRVEDPRFRYRPADPEEPIEGITDPDVGWCKVKYVDLVACYAQCIEANGWPSFYKRPPKLAYVSF